MANLDSTNIPNKDRNPTKSGMPVSEPKTPQPQVFEPNKKKPTATDTAAHTTGTSTVTDGESG